MDSDANLIIGGVVIGGVLLLIVARGRGARLSPAKRVLVGGLALAFPGVSATAVGFGRNFVQRSCGSDCSVLGIRTTLIGEAGLVLLVLAVASIFVAVWLAVQHALASEARRSGDTRRFVGSGPQHHERRNRAQKRPDADGPPN